MATPINKKGMASSSNPWKTAQTVCHWDPSGQFIPSLRTIPIQVERRGSWFQKVGGDFGICAAVGDGSGLFLN